jgi:hypothetical protein
VLPVVTNSLPLSAEASLPAVTEVALSAEASLPAVTEVALSAAASLPAVTEVEVALWAQVPELTLALLREVSSLAVSAEASLPVLTEHPALVAVQTVSPFLSVTYLALAQLPVVVLFRVLATELVEARLKP